MNSNMSARLAGGPDNHDGMTPAMIAQAEWIRERMEGRDEALLEEDGDLSIRGPSSAPCLIAVESASGIWITDHAGRKYMDLYGNNCHHIGHHHPQLIAALKAQMDTLAFVPRGLTSAPSVEFPQRLRAAAGWPDAKVVSARSGADAIEIALALARANTGRYKTISFYDAYHGRSSGALSLGGRADDKLGLGPLLPGAIHVPPYFRFGREALGENHEAYARQSLEAIRTVFEYERDIAAVVAETIRNGAYAPPDWYWHEVRGLCDEFGALLILDEIATGLGKTGSLFNYHRYCVRPDIVVLGKALGGAVLPLSAVLADARLDRMPQLNIGYFTHEKNPLCARAGLATLEIIEQGKLPERAMKLGAHAAARIAALPAQYAVVRETRSAGLMFALEFRDSGQRDSAEQMSRKVQRACIDRGLLPTIPKGASLTFSAPLIIEQSELDQAIDVLCDAISACC